MAQLTSIPQSSDPRYFSVNGTNITCPLNPPIMRYSTLIDLDNLTYGIQRWPWTILAAMAMAVVMRLFMRLFMRL